MVDLAYIDIGVKHQFFAFSAAEFYFSPLPKENCFFLFMLLMRSTKMDPGLVVILGDLSFLICLQYTFCY